MSTAFSFKQIEDARKAAFEKIKDWLYDDIGLVVQNNGDGMRHKLADFETSLTLLEHRLTAKNAEPIAKETVIDFFLEESKRAGKYDDPRVGREYLMSITQFASALDVRKDVELAAKSRSTGTQTTLEK